MRISASAPTRIDLAGGTIDIWPLYLFHDGAQTINVAISLRASAVVDTRGDGRVVIHSEDTGGVVDVPDVTHLDQGTTLPLLRLLVRWFSTHGRDSRVRGGLTLTTSSESPAGAGIAGSSALNVAVCAALARWSGYEADEETLLEIAKNIEAVVIGVPTGLQDYRPAMYGGVAALTLDAAGITRVPLDVNPESIHARFVLCYTGEPRSSGTNNWEIVKRHIDGDQGVIDGLARIRDTAAAMRTALAAGDWHAVGLALAEEWRNRKRLAPGVTTPTIDALVDAASRAGATAAKICGAGGGGCLLCLAPPERRSAVAAALQDAGARLLPFQVDQRGLVYG
ncbi:MAG: GHMP kinase [Acidimicrobiia bacterium]|nr:GHMP kinase [Acidimicrobiia bacterium]